MNKLEKNNIMAQRTYKGWSEESEEIKEFFKVEEAKVEALRDIATALQEIAKKLERNVGRGWAPG